MAKLFLKRKKAWDLFLLTAFCLLLTSCDSGKEESGELSGNTLDFGIAALQFYSEAAYPLPGGYTIAGIARLDNCLLLAGNGDRGAVLGFADYSLTDAGRVALSEAQVVDLEDPDVTVYGAAAGGDGYFHVLTGTRQDGGQNEGNFSLLCYSREGTLQRSVPLSCGSDASIDGVQVGYGGEIVLYGYAKGKTDTSALYPCFLTRGSWSIPSFPTAFLSSVPHCARRESSSPV